MTKHLTKMFTSEGMCSLFMRVVIAPHHLVDTKHVHAGVDVGRCRLTNSNEAALSEVLSCGTRRNGFTLETHFANLVAAHSVKEAVH
ncbi:unannotated protein [freshwater metagenome]|uniref:Unannotated protein n=1 Tax=freshwater metagenome TaxID=449393 RepID=A0A6J7IHI0_9ZZZZ